MPHSAIAVQALAQMPESVERREWWAQGTAVAYEQHCGLRVPGQSCTGDFQLSTSRTVSADKDAALQAWSELVAAREEFGGVAVAAPTPRRVRRSGATGGFCWWTELAWR